MLDNHTNNYNHIEGNNNCINNTTNNIINNNHRIQPILEAEETNEATLVKKEFIKLLFSVITPIITFIVKSILESFDNSNNIVLLLRLLFQFAIVFVPIFSFLAIILIAKHLWQIKKQLKNNPIVLKSILDFLLSMIPNNSNFSPREIAGKVYVSKNNKIYRIVGCTCPKCKVGTIGKMSLKKHDNKLYLQCNQNHNHEFKFDPKNFDFKITNDYL